MMNSKLMLKDYQKYLDVTKAKEDMFNKTFEESDCAEFEFSFIIYLITNLKEQQSNLFKNSLTLLKQILNKNKELRKLRTGNNDEDIYKLIQSNEDFVKKSIQEIIIDTSKSFESTCKHINDHLDKIEEDSDIAPIVFGDAKIKNKERNQKSKEFTTIYHKDIENFIKEYKLIGFEYDKRIKLVDSQEIFNRLYDKIFKTLEKSIEK